MIYYDSSALLKLVRQEAESEAFGRWFAERRSVPAVSSLLAIVEVGRVALREGSEVVQRAAAILDGVRFVQLTEGLLDNAAALPHPLRSLDAIHLASAMRLSSALEAFVAYDRRLVAAAAAAGLPTAAPGAAT